MTTTGIVRLAAGLFAALAACSGLRAQDAAPPVGAPATRPAGDAASDSLDKILDTMTPEQLADILKKAAADRLKVERQQVAVEIGGGLLYEPNKIQEALAILKDKPADTQADNIDRILRAFAAVDIRLAGPYRLYAEKKYDKAAAELKLLLDPQQTTLFSAAKHYLYAAALAQSGNDADAVEAYRDLMINMPDRISFAASASLEAARLYDKMGRFLYAMQMYDYCLQNYSLTLDPPEAERLLKKIDEMREISKDPLGTLAARMEHVEKRLGGSDSGKDTQAREREIVALLEDLIKTVEEKQSQKGQGKGNQNKQNQGQSQEQTQVAGQPKGGNPNKTNNPSNPAMRSMVVPGEVERPTKLSEVHAASEQDDWSRLPPREQERLRDLARKAVGERYRDIISDYHSKLAEQKKP